MREDTSTVAIRAAPPGAVNAAVRMALEAVSWREGLGNVQSVLVKPNLGYDFIAPGANTSRAVLSAVCQFFVEEGLNVIIIEADQVLVDVEQAARLAGVPVLCREFGVKWVNLSEQPFRTRRLPSGKVFGQIELPEILSDAPLVNLPVMKTHAKTGMSGAIKNLWGLLPIDRHRYHPVVDQALVELYKLVPIALTLMDATVAMEGNGPKTGTPRQLDTVLASTDAVAIDRLAAHIMGLPMHTIPHLAALSPDPHQLPEIDGSVPSCLPFRRPRHNTVSWLETRLRASRLEPLVFNTPIFDLCCLGARA